MLLQQTPRRVAHLHAPHRLLLGSSSVPAAAALHSSARQGDHYKTLEVPKGASQQDIKAQFYKLSKKWHPDMNPDSENANQKFQQVSEAYATLGSAANRKDYDRQLSSSRHGSPRGTNRGQFRYASENVARRASAAYAWDYQQRRSAPRDGGAARHSAKYHEFGGRHPPPSTSMFERFAERERKREAATAARMSGAGKGGSNNASTFVSQEEHDAQTSSPIIRFCQVAGLFYVIFFFASKFGSSGESKRAR